jgi:hypothetical protein
MTNKETKLNNYQQRMHEIEHKEWLPNREWSLKLRTPRGEMWDL